MGWLWYRNLLERVRRRLRQDRIAWYRREASRRRLERDDLLRSSISSRKGRWGIAFDRPLWLLVDLSRERPKVVDRFALPTAAFREMDKRFYQDLASDLLNSAPPEVAQ